MYNARAAVVPERFEPMGDPAGAVRSHMSLLELQWQRSADNSPQTGTVAV